MSHTTHTTATQGAARGDAERAPVERAELPLGHRAQRSGGAPPADHRPAAGQIRRAARGGVQSPTVALPHRAQLAAVLGEDAVASVRAHVDPASTEAMDAQAYATGEDVVFGTASPSVEVVAHEVAHVVQQRQGVSLSDGVGRAGDAHEQQADAAAAAVVRGEVSAVPAELRAAPSRGGGAVGVQRKAKDEGYAPLAATGEAAEFAENSATAVRTRRGQRGYAKYAIADASRASETAASMGRVHEYARLAPWLADLEQDQQHRLDEQVRLGPEDKERSPWNVGGLSHELSQQAAAAAGRSAEGIALVAERHLATLKSYNDWASVADGFNVALYQLSELMEIFGADSEVAFLGAIEREIGVASQVKMTANFASSSMEGADVPDFDVPADDGRFQDASDEMSTAFGELQAAHKGWRVHQLKLESLGVDSQIAGVAVEQAEIESTIAFIKSLGSTIDTTAGMLTKSSSLITTGQAKIAKGEAVLNTYRNRDAWLQGHEGPHNTTYITFDESGSPVVKNYETRTSSTASVDGGKVTIGTKVDDLRKDEASLGNVPELPGSAADVFGKAAELVYEEDIRACKAKIQKLESHKKVLGAMIDLNAYEETAIKLTTAMSNVLNKLKQFRNLAEERHRAFLQFGEQLDKFASSGQLERAALKRFEAGHREAESRQEDLDTFLSRASPEFDTARSGEVAPLGERFAAVLGVASVVQQAMHAGGMAESLRLDKGLTTDALSQLYEAHHSCREPAAGYEHLMKPLTPSKTELARLESVHTNVSQFERTWQTWGPGLGRVSTSLNDLTGVDGNATREFKRDEEQSDES